MSNQTDWAETRAQEWLETVELDDEADIASLAALLREVRAGEYKCPDCGCLTIWAPDQYKADLLAEVRRVVEEEGAKWEHHSVAPLAIREILSRLEKL